MSKSLVEVENLKKTFGFGGAETPALKGVNFSIPQGEFAALAGSSGCGKTTCLNLIGGLDRPSAGKVTISGTDLTGFSDDQISSFRRVNLGFVFQSFNLLPVLSAIENVEYPLLRVPGLSARERRERASQQLAQVGLEHRLHNRPDQLSGGQKQRVAIARALVHRPLLVLADEPTANLDRKTAREIIGLMQELNSSLGTTFIFSTHDPEILEVARLQIHLADGLVTKVIDGSLAKVGSQ